MQCENYLCIYYENDECTLDEISLDACGRCYDCILINFDEKILEDARQKHLKSYEYE